MRTQSYVLAALFATCEAVQLSHRHHHHNDFVQFATGMNGNEELNEFAEMNHQKYSYAQALPECNGGPNNKPGVNCKAAEQSFA